MLIFFISVISEKGTKMGYSKYAWIGNRISEEDMACLYKMKVKTRKRITEMVAEAVKLYINSLNCLNCLNGSNDSNGLNGLNENSIV